MSLDLLLNAFANVLTRSATEQKNNEPKQIEKEKFTVSGKIASIKDALIIRKQLRFSELFRESISRDEIITTFLALLELLKLQEIRCVQSGAFQDIDILKVDNEENNG